MHKSLAAFGAAALIALGVAVGGPTATADSGMKQCGNQWQAAKAAGTTNGQTWPQFLAKCRAQQKTGAGTAAPAHAQQTTDGPEPAPARAGEFATEQQARARCPSETVVWVNTLSHVCHFPGVSSHGRSYYGHTKEGALHVRGGREGSGKPGGA